MICPHCHKPNPDTSLYCKNCGDILTAPVRSSPISHSNTSITDIICPYCRTVNKSNAGFCKKCGSIIETAVSYSPPAGYRSDPLPPPAMNQLQNPPLVVQNSPLAPVGVSYQPTPVPSYRDEPRPPQPVTQSPLIRNVAIAHPEQPHCPLILLLDVSGSMEKDNKIGQLNEGLRVFKEEILKDDLASRRIDVTIVTFGDRVSLASDFTPITEFYPPVLHAGGLTAMGEAILTSIDIVEQRKNQYKNQGIDYFRPWVFMITDGEPSDMSPGDTTWNRVISALHGAEANNKLLFFSVGIDPANIDILKQITPPARVPIKLRPGNFAEMFQWLSNSQEKIVHQDLGADAAGLNLDAPTGWGEIMYR